MLEPELPAVLEEASDERALAGRGVEEPDAKLVGGSGPARNERGGECGDAKRLHCGPPSMPIWSACDPDPIGALLPSGLTRLAPWREPRRAVPRHCRPGREHCRAGKVPAPPHGAHRS